MNARLSHLSSSHCARQGRRLADFNFAISGVRRARLPREWWLARHKQPSPELRVSMLVRVCRHCCSTLSAGRWYLPEAASRTIDEHRQFATGPLATRTEGPRPLQSDSRVAWVHAGVLQQTPVAARTPNTENDDRSRRRSSSTRVVVCDTHLSTLFAARGLAATGIVRFRGVRK